MTTTTTTTTTTRGATMTTVTHTFPLLEAITAASAVLPHASRDDVPRVIAAAKVASDYWVATDRYTIARWDIERGGEDSPHYVEDAPTESILLPREAIEWVAKIAPAKLRRTTRYGNAVQLYSLHVSQELGEPAFAGGDPVLGDVTVSIVWNGASERSQSFDAVTGNYPPVERLLEDWAAATDAMPTALDPIHLEKVTAFAKKHDKSVSVTFELGASTGNTDKPGPMRATFARLTAIIQPNILPR